MLRLSTSQIDLSLMRLAISRLICPATSDCSSSPGRKGCVPCNTKPCSKIISSSFISQASLTTIRHMQQMQHELTSRMSAFCSHCVQQKWLNETLYGWNELSLTPNFLF